MTNQDNVGSNEALEMAMSAEAPREIHHYRVRIPEFLLERRRDNGMESLLGQSFPSLEEVAKTAEFALKYQRIDAERGSMTNNFTALNTWATQLMLCARLMGLVRAIKDGKWDERFVGSQVVHHDAYMDDAFITYVDPGITVYGYYAPRDHTNTAERTRVDQDLNIPPFMRNKTIV